MLVLGILLLNAAVLARVLWVVQQRDRLNCMCMHARANMAAAGDDISGVPWWHHQYEGVAVMVLKFWVWDVERFRL